MNSKDIEKFIDAAMRCGDESEDDKDIAALQIALRIAWSLMTKPARRTFMKVPEIKEILRWLK